LRRDQRLTASHRPIDRQGVGNRQLLRHVSGPPTSPSRTESPNSTPDFDVIECHSHRHHSEIIPSYAFHRLLALNGQKNVVSTKSAGRPLPSPPPLTLRFERQLKRSPPRCHPATSGSVDLAATSKPQHIRPTTRLQRTHTRPGASLSAMTNALVASKDIPLRILAKGQLEFRLLLRKAFLELPPRNPS